MNFVNLGKQIYKKILSKKDPLFKISVEKQNQILKIFPDPIDDIERSYYQYLCQTQGLSKIYNLMFNFVSFFLYIFYFYIKSNDKINDSEVEKAIFIGYNDNYSCIPKELFDEYKSIKQTEITGFILTKQDKLLINKISKRHQLSYYFLTKILLKIGIYRNNIEKYNPDIIIVTSEYSFTSSVLTLFCENNLIEHIDIMHGEKLLYIRDSFFRFNRVYVWDQYFIDLFIELRADKNNFIVAKPPSQEKWINDSVSKEIDFTYFLQNQQKKELLKIHTILKELKTYGNVVSVRPHPTYSNMKLIRSIFFDLIIEDISKISIEYSILRTRNVISLFSTVNRQAYNNNISFILDDISDKKKFSQLVDLKYFFINHNSKILSEYIEGYKNGKIR